MTFEEFAKRGFYFDASILELKTIYEKEEGFEAVFRIMATNEIIKVYFVRCRSHVAVVPNTANQLLNMNEGNQIKEKEITNE